VTDAPKFSLRYERLFGTLGCVAVLQRTLLGADEPHVDRAAYFERLDLGNGAWIDLARSWLLGADTLLDAVIDGVEWGQGRRWMYDRMVDDPRLSCWIKHRKHEPHPAFKEIRAALVDRYDVTFGGFGLNYYRDGRDSVAWHRDRELRHLDSTLIAIVTLGAARPFLVRPLGGGKSRDLRPASGDLLVMGGSCQKTWEHSVPKVAHAGPRISATLRWSSEKGPITYR
jgi:alkylated DNA repair dioxygenase AlkB